MAPFVIFAVADGGEPFGAVMAGVGLLTRVRAHVHQQVPLLSEDLPAALFQTLEKVVA